MTVFSAVDDAQGAPIATCGHLEAAIVLAPTSCLFVAGSVPLAFTFNRSDYTWLALALSAHDDSGAPAATLDTVFYGTHTLTWVAMHGAVERAWLAGFRVAAPSDFEAAVKAALVWSLPRREQLRKLGGGDFEPLPALPRPALVWWRQIPFETWAHDGLFQALCQAIGFAGRVWEAGSRLQDTRFHLSLVLTQEFVPVSPSLPLALYGEPAVRFFTSTMPPPALLVFPTSSSRILWAMNVRWWYQHGTPSQISDSLNTLLPLMLSNAHNLAQFLQPSHGGSTQVAAYKLIANTLAPSFELHRVETIIYIDERLSKYMAVLSPEGGLGSAASPEAKAFLLKAAVEKEKAAVQAAPGNDSPFLRGDPSGGPATQTTMQALVELRLEPAVRELESSLRQVWNTVEQNPMEVFRRTLHLRSVTCNAILFSNLTGVKAAGHIYAILEQVSGSRLAYFSMRLATPKNSSLRPDYNCWYSYPERIDTAIRSADFDTFSKINLFELGAQLRKLQKKVTGNPSDVPRPGGEFSSEGYVQHLHLLTYLKPWFEALGFPVEGEFGFATALQTLDEFCQLGSHHHSHVLHAHVGNMRSLYVAMLRDMHEGMSCFWNRRLHAYDLLVRADTLFPEHGNFYGTYRKLNAELESINLLTAFGYVSPSAQPGSQKRPMQLGESSGAATREPQAKRANQAPVPDYSKVGSFAMAVVDGPTHVIIGASKYDKAQVLAKLNVPGDQICLPAFLCKKGAAACPAADKAGHESHTSAQHTFPAAMLSLRPLFEDAPFRTASGDEDPLRRIGYKGPANKKGANNKGKGKASRK